MTSFEEKLSRKAVVLSILIASSVIILYSIYTSSYYSLFKINITYLLLAFILYLFSWIVSGVRLKLLHIILDGEENSLSLKHYINARFLGGLMAYLTPSAIGGEPARAYYLSRLMNNSFSRYFALSIYEVFYDIVVVNIIAIGFSLYRLPLTIPVIIVGLANLSFWIISYQILNNIIKPEQANPLIKKILLFMEKYFVSRIELLDKGYRFFGEAFHEISSKAGFSEKILAYITTFTCHLLVVLAIYVIASSIMHGTSLELFISSFTAYFYAMSISALPTPGGSIVVEYGLSLSLDPDVVVVVRSMTYYTVIIIGFIVLFRYGFVREVIK